MPIPMAWIHRVIMIFKMIRWLIFCLGARIHELSFYRHFFAFLKFMFIIILALISIILLTLCFINIHKLLSEIYDFWVIIRWFWNIVLTCIARRVVLYYNFVGCIGLVWLILLVFFIIKYFFCYRHLMNIYLFFQILIFIICFFFRLVWLF